MKEAVRSKALQLGFDDCRFTTADAPPHAAEFQAWLGQSRHGEMGYLERNAHKRIDPQRVLPGAKSIIVLAASYENTPISKPPAATATGIIARYARYADYHDILAERLKTLTAFLDAICSVAVSAASSGGVSPPVPGTDSRIESKNRPLTRPSATLSPSEGERDGERGPTNPLVSVHEGGQGEVRVQAKSENRSLWYVDTGPILERDLSQRAGLGFIGKHTNLIGRRLGNWIFLAEIITTLEFEPDPPEKNRCGTCTRCIAACPTAAITAPFQLDARRCISYLTIELKGPIPVELRPAIGNRIYGCDDCLAACPWNRFAREGRLMRDHARADLTAPDLLELLALDEPAFQRRFAGTPILRTKRRGLLRNVCIALGNVGDSTALPGLQKAAADPEPLIAEHAQWAILEIEKRMKSGPDPSGRALRDATASQ